MTTRKEKAVQRKKVRRTRVAIASIITGVLVTLLACVALYLSGDRAISSIEKSISKGTDVLVISEIQDETWEYFMYLSGYNYPQIDGAETIGFANDDAKSFIYLTGDTKKIKDDLSDRAIPYGEKDGVVALGHDGWNFSDDSLGNNDEYKSRAGETESKATFAYINFEELRSSYPEQYYYAVPQLGKWFGDYSGNEWNGTVTSDISKMDETKMNDEVARNPVYRDFVSSASYKNGEWNASPVTVGVLADIDYETNIESIKFKLTNENLSISLGQESKNDQK